MIGIGSGALFPLFYRLCTLAAIAWARRTRSPRFQIALQQDRRGDAIHNTFSRLPTDIGSD
jgi:hypothetical protein